VTTTVRPDIEGRSKKLWLSGDGTCVVELVPSLRSFTYHRDELVEGTAALRLDFYERAAARLADAGIRTAFQTRLGPARYRATYRPAPPFEVIVKNRAVGSTTIKYPGLFPAGERLPRPVVKFDYRVDPEDQPIGEDYLRVLDVPVDAFRQTALAVNTTLRTWLAPLDLWDFCLILAVDSDRTPIVISEVSPDCMRLRHPDGSKLDKDLFRDGARPEEILTAWRRLLDELG
jgi:phosphoribosylaminoimidazole-succinocarboxamide synthase